MAVIGIRYDGGNFHDENSNLIEHPIIYECVTLSVSGENYYFKSGDFVKDWALAKKKFTEFEGEGRFSQSSSVNHFIMDGAEYDSAYLHVENGVPILKYLDRSKDNWLCTQRDIYENGWEYFVPKGKQFTWEELKEYCLKEN